MEYFLIHDVESNIWLVDADMGGFTFKKDYALKFSSRDSARTVLFELKKQAKENDEPHAYDHCIVEKQYERDDD